MVPIDAAGGAMTLPPPTALELSGPTSTPRPATSGRNSDAAACLSCLGSVPRCCRCDTGAKAVLPMLGGAPATFGVVKRRLPVVVGQECSQPGSPGNHWS